MDRPDVMAQIERAFADVPHPGDPFLLGSHDGCEPLDEVSAFHGITDWHGPTAEFLDLHYAVMSFFSEGGFRFFLPAFLLADLRNALKTADPLFHLTHGFWEFSIEHRIGDRVFTRTSGRSQFINPRRYGATTFHDYARFRLSVFGREECTAIVAYLEFSRGLETRDTDHEAIDRALDLFWRERAASAPTAAEMQRHVAAEADYMNALMHQRESR